jgi:hypothetical protein
MAGIHQSRTLRNGPRKRGRKPGDEHESETAAASAMGVPNGPEGSALIQTARAACTASTRLGP